MRWPWKKSESFNLRHSDGAICGNSEAVDILRIHGYRGKAAVIPQLGVDLDFYSPSPNPSLREKLRFRKTVIGFIGRLVEEKGIQILAEAVGQLGSEITLLLLGSGPLEAKLAEFQKAYGVHIVHVPPVSHDEVRDYLRAIDILVLPSYSTPTWKEQFGHVLIEAMGCEIPVVGSSTKVLRWVIGEAGLIFEERSAKDLCAKLRGLVSCPSERLRLGKLGRKRVIENFTHAEIGRQTLEFWKSL